MPTESSTNALGILSDVLCELMTSSNVADSNLEPANVVDVIDRVGRGALAIADAITPRDALGGPGADGSGHVASLTEAVMDASRSLSRIADAISDFAEIIRLRDS